MSVRRHAQLCKPVGLWAAFGRQLRHPHGLGGRIAGHIMRIVNRSPNNQALAYLHVEPDDHVLEIGFGPGRALAELAKKIPHGHVIGIDISDVMLGQASAYNLKSIQSGDMTLLLGTFNALPLSTASVDKILAVNVLYFFGSAGHELSELYRVLRPGGKISFYATEHASLAAWSCAWSETHRTFDAKGLKEFLENSPFVEDIIDIYQVRMPMGIRGLIGTIIETLP